MFIGGAVAGAAAVLLLTSENGKEVREKLSGFASEAKKRAQEFCEQVKENMAEAQAEAAAENTAGQEKEV